jgi:hypothetical protein
MGAKGLYKKLYQYDILKKLFDMITVNLLKNPDRRK